MPEARAGTRKHVVQSVQRRIGAPLLPLTLKSIPGERFAPVRIEMQNASWSE